MDVRKRKRGVSSCIPCYTRKQKCNRQYPCDHCSRRRRPELCTYYLSRDIQAPNLPENRQDEETRTVNGLREDSVERRASESSPTSVAIKTSKEQAEPSSLAEVFGYFEESRSNTMALVRRLGVHEDNMHNGKDLSITAETEAEVQKTLEKMPSRPILDFMVRYFVAEVNWMDQLLYPPWFLEQYQKWWTIDRPSSVTDIEFPVLFLRVCWYASQFLPSPSYTIDSIRGVALVDIRRSCNDVADVLEPICTRLDTRGSLLRVQHLAFTGLGSLCQGRTNAFWEALGCAVRVAQRIGMHLDATIWANGMDELEKEMRRRTFCSLYVWDSDLSRRLDRVPLLPDGLSPEIMPQMHLVPDFDDAVDAPDVFTERVLQVQLADFWRIHSPTKGSEYNAIAAEERYELFCSKFLPTVPPAFSLQPDKQWDERLPMLPLQRQSLHMAIFDYLCYNFRPALLQDPSQIKDLPGYKQILLSSHKKALAVAALNLLEGVSTLHMMIGGSHTRFAGIIVPTFEAAVLLLCLCADSGFLGDTAEAGSNIMKTDPLGVGMANATRAKCMQAVRSALDRLQTLAEVSNMAEVGARTLTRLIRNVDSSPMHAQICGGSAAVIDPGMQISEPWSCDQIQEYTGAYSTADFFSDADYGAIHGNWEEMAVLSSTSGNGDIGSRESE